MSLTYATYVTSLANMLVIPPTDAYYLTMLPNCIDDAEQRIRRELDLLAFLTIDQTGVLTANSRNFTFPQHFVVSESINVFTPTGSIISTSVRNPLTPVTREFIDAIWPTDASTTSPSVPQYYAMVNDQTIVVGPPPDQNYPIEIKGTIIPAPLSATNTTTWISTYLPDLFLAESLIFGYGYLKDNGAATDDPTSSASWTKHYMDLWQSAMSEEARKKYQSQGWTPKQPNNVATPPRV
jgi:hypothetical protein